MYFIRFKLIKITSLHTSQFGLLSMEDLSSIGEDNRGQNGGQWRTKGQKGGQWRTNLKIDRFLHFLAHLE